MRMDLDSRACRSCRRAGVDTHTHVTETYRSPSRHAQTHEHDYTHDQSHIHAHHAHTQYTRMRTQSAYQAHRFKTAREHLGEEDVTRLRGGGCMFIVMLRQLLIVRNPTIHIVTIRRIRRDVDGSVLAFDISR